MTKETKQLIFKEIDADIRKDGDKYILVIGKKGYKVDISRFSSQILSKLAKTDEQFAELPIGALISGEIECDFHFETEHYVREIDGRDGSEDVVVDKTNRILNDCKMEILNDNVELQVIDFCSYLSDSEKLEIADAIIEHYESKHNSGIIIK